jgi:hypothetical protein
VDVADDLGGGVDVGAGGDDGREAVIGADHGNQYRSCADGSYADGEGWGSCGADGGGPRGGGRGFLLPAQ